MKIEAIWTSTPKNWKEKLEKKFKKIKDEYLNEKSTKIKFAKNWKKKN